MLIPDIEWKGTVSLCVIRETRRKKADKKLVVELIRDPKVKEEQLENIRRVEEVNRRLSEPSRLPHPQ